MATTTLADQAKQNGSAENGSGAEDEPRPGAVGSITGLLGRALGGVTERISNRLTADLDDRDPDYIRDNLPLTWLVSSIWFRGEVRNLGHIPADRAVLMVGNHSGGNMTPDTIVLQTAFSTYFGVERAFYQLAHNLVIASPYGQLLRRWGTVSASHENARKALESGAALLVYPGGDWEVHRSVRDRHKVDFNGRRGFVRLALDAGVPIVPVVSVGGQETSLFITRGAGLARALGVDRLFRLKVLPISVAPPWGLNIGDFLGHIPLPAKITIEVLSPIDLERDFGPEPDVDEVYEHVTRVMQEALDALAAERRFPVIG